MSNKERDAALRRIRALRAKTTDNGCTESEAMSAAVMVAELMQRYQITEEDAKAKRVPMTEGAYFCEDKTLGPVVYCINSIAEYCYCTAFCEEMPLPVEHRINNSTARHVIAVYFGRDHDVECATYLTHLFHTAIESAWIDHVRGVSAHRTNKQEFQEGMAVRLSQRLHVMHKQRTKINNSERNALVSLQMALVDEEFAKRYRQQRFEERRMELEIASHSSLRGFEAADKVAINPGVGADKRDAKQIK